MPIYLAPLVRSSLYADPGETRQAFHARGMEPGSGAASIMDLRPTSTLIDGWCLLGAKLALPSDPRIVKLAESHTEALPLSVRTRLENELSITLSAGRLGDAIGEIMTQHARADGTRWKPLGESWRNATRTERAVQAWLGGELVYEANVRPAPHNTIIIDDRFGGSRANGTDLTGIAPDTTNTPGNSWAGPANHLEFDGSDQIKTNSSGTKSNRIDTGTTDFRADVDFNAGGADNRAGISARGSNHDHGNAAMDKYTFNFRPAVSGSDNEWLFKYVNNSQTILAQDEQTLGASTTLKFGLEVDGSGSQRMYVDDVLNANLNGSDTEIDGTTIGGSFADLIHFLFTNGAARFDSFVVDDLAAAATFTKTASLNAAVLAAKAKSAGMNAALLASRTDATAIDGALTLARMAQASLDAAARGEIAKTAQIRAALQISGTAAAVLSAALRVGGAKTASLQAALTILRATSAGLDANLSAEGVAMLSAELDGALQRASALSGGLDAGLAIALMRAASADAAISRGLTGTAPLQAALRDSVALAGALDAVLGDVHAPPGARTFKVPGAGVRTFNVPGAGARTLVIPPGKRRH